MRIDEFEDKLKNIYSYNDLQQLILQLQADAKDLQRNDYHPKLLLDALYKFRNQVKVSSIINNSLFNQLVKKELKKSE